MSRALALVAKSNGGRIDLGLAAGPTGLRGTLDAAARVNDAVELIAQGHIANSKDWAALAGVRVQW